MGAESYEGADRSAHCKNYIKMTLEQALNLDGHLGSIAYLRNYIINQGAVMPFHFRTPSTSRSMCCLPRIC